MKIAVIYGENQVNGDGFSHQIRSAGLRQEKRDITKSKKERGTERGRNLGMN